VESDGCLVAPAVFKTVVGSSNGSRYVRFVPSPPVSKLLLIPASHRQPDAGIGRAWTLDHHYLCIGKVDPGIAFAVPRNGKVDPVISLANSKSDFPDPELARVIKSSAFSISGPRPPIFGPLPPIFGSLRLSWDASAGLEHASTTRAESCLVGPQETHGRGTSPVKFRS